MEEFENELIGNIEATTDRINSLEDPSELEVLDVEYRADVFGDIKNVILTVTVGGPRIDINLGRKMVIGYWSGTERSHSIEKEKARLLMDYYAELWESR